MAGVNFESQDNVPSSESCYSDSSQTDYSSFTDDNIDERNAQVNSGIEWPDYDKIANSSKRRRITSDNAIMKMNKLKSNDNHRNTMPSKKY